MAEAEWAVRPRRSAAQSSRSADPEKPARALPTLPLSHSLPRSRRRVRVSPLPRSRRRRVELSPAQPLPLRRTAVRCPSPFPLPPCRRRKPPSTWLMSPYSVRAHPSRSSASSLPCFWTDPPPSSATASPPTTPVSTRLASTFCRFICLVSFPDLTCIRCIHIKSVVSYPILATNY